MGDGERQMKGHDFGFPVWAPSLLTDEELEKVPTWRLDRELTHAELNIPTVEFSYAVLLQVYKGRIRAELARRNIKII